MRDSSIDWIEEVSVKEVCARARSFTYWSCRMLQRSNSSQEVCFGESVVGGACRFVFIVRIIRDCTNVEYRSNPLSCFTMIGDLRHKKNTKFQS
jgi:hypothetical protein